MLKNNDGPLMFINSVQTKNEGKKGQQVYDSRNPVKIEKKEEPKKELKLNDEEISLLMKVISLKSNDNKFNCEFYCGDVLYSGVPKEIDGTNLIIVNHGEEQKIDLFEIEKFLIG